MDRKFAGHFAFVITTTKSGDLVTLINVFICEPQNQRALVDAWVRATEEAFGKLPGIISASLHKSKEGTRVVNYAQWKSSEDWQKLLEVLGKRAVNVEHDKVHEEAA